MLLPAPIAFASVLPVAFMSVAFMPAFMSVASVGRVHFDIGVHTAIHVGRFASRVSVEVLDSPPPHA